MSRLLRAALLLLVHEVAALIPALRPGKSGRGAVCRRAIHVDIVESDVEEWYILQCVTGSELWCKRTIDELLREEGNRDVLERVPEVAVPTELVAATRGKSIKTKEKILYPGYVFISTRINQRVRDWFISAPRVINFIGDDDLVRNGANDVIPGFRGKVTPIPLTPLEVHNMLQNRAVGSSLDGNSTAILESFMLGDAVAVTKRGGLMGERGLVRAVKDGTLLVSLTGGGSRTLEVPLDFGDVRKLTENEMAEAHKREIAKMREEVAAAERAALQPADVSSDEKVLAARAKRRAAERRQGLPSNFEEAVISERPSRWEVKAAVEEEAVLPGSGEVSQADADFFDGLLLDLEDDAPAPPLKQPAPPQDADDDALLRSLLGDFDDDDDDDDIALDLGIDDVTETEDVTEMTPDVVVHAPQELEVTTEEVMMMTVPQVKEELRARGLKLSGVKAELVARLQEHDANL